VKYGACDSVDAGNAKRITYVIGPDGKISQVHPKVNPSNHAAELLESL
jgi:peroxiredoxin